MRRNRAPIYEGLTFFELDRAYRDLTPGAYRAGVAVGRALANLLWWRP